jgi:excisionase family DNA binding protein
MAMITLGEAARITGLGKTTLARAIKSGRLSATRADAGSYQIDPAELNRVYPFTAPQEATHATVAATDRMVRQATPADTGATLAEQVAMLRSLLDDMKADRDSWRSMAERLSITDQRDRRPWWRKIAG